jgi:hypothetical protein
MNIVLRCQLSQAARNQGRARRGVAPRASERADRDSAERSRAIFRPHVCFLRGREWIKLPGLSTLRPQRLGSPIIYVPRSNLATRRVDSGRIAGDALGP